MCNRTKKTDWKGCNNSKICLLKHINKTSLNHESVLHILGKYHNKMLIIIFQFGVNSNQHHYLPLSGLQMYFTIIAGQQGGNNIDGGGGADFVVVLVVSKLCSVFVFPKLQTLEPLNLQQTESTNGIKRVE